MAVYQTKYFARWARKQGLTTDALCEAVQEVKSGLLDADLGGGLVKKRIAGKGRGKRGSFRTIIATGKSNRWIFLFGFAKSERSNIDEDELAALKKLTTHLLSLTNQAIAKAQSAGELIEVKRNA